MRWTSIVRVKSWTKGYQESFIICTSQQRDLNIISMKRQSIDRANHKFFDSTKADDNSRQTFPMKYRRRETHLTSSDFTFKDRKHLRHTYKYNQRRGTPKHPLL